MGTRTETKIRLTPEMLKRIREAARSERRSMNFWIVEQLERALGGKVVDPKKHQQTRVTTGS